MIPPDEALRLVCQHAVALAPRDVALEEACGLQLAQPVAADRHYPPFARAMMDGYAVRLGDAGRTVPVVGQVAAGDRFAGAMEPGGCVEIMTGAPCPPGTEAVVPKEHVRRSGSQVSLPGQLRAGQHIAEAGSECPAGRVVLQPGQTITPMAVAVMASFGIVSVRVVPRPSVAIITTGGELVPAASEPGEGQIRDSNGPMLAALARDVALERPSCLHVEDQLEAILDALERSADHNLVLLTGGVSVGTYDLVPAALERYGAEVVFHKVRQKPGKPLLFARKQNQLVFGLPGNPLSCHFCFHRYVAPAAQRMSGKPAPAQALPGTLTAPVEPKAGRTYFVTARAEPGEEGQWLVHPLPTTSSADIFASWPANCYAQVPPGKEPIPAGHVLPFTWIGSAPWPY
ncbi:MAG TPA: molybdopterin molybdenumtransferase MoeA [Planctomycetes bacterium]|nr:molybdopterin molybdenumtransferase MoeA [Planctomycetota bacterium]